MSQLNTPILFIIFNRKDTALRVFEMIRKIQPRTLYVAADGPRASRPGEEIRCQETRALIGQVDWPCEVRTLFRETNLGCKKAVSGAITWFFSQVNEGIILEDDCLPDPTFFSYCENLLERYRDDRRIMHIGGVNFQDGIQRSTGSYFFSRKPQIWGWATWKRAWDLYDPDILSYPEFKKNHLIRFITRDTYQQKIFLRKFDSVYDHSVDTWDFQWEYTILTQNGLAITPEKNLVSNIGFGADATHTTSYHHDFADKPVESMPEIRHPIFIFSHEEADLYQFKKEFSGKNIAVRAWRKLKRILKIRL
jgi:hypothetical protein